MLCNEAKTFLCNIFAVNLDKINLSYDKSIRYSQKENHRPDER